MPAQDGGPYLDAGWQGYIMADMLGVKLTVFVVPSAEEYGSRSPWQHYTLHKRLGDPEDRLSNVVRSRLHFANSRSVYVLCMMCSPSVGLDHALTSTGVQTVGVLCDREHHFWGLVPHRVPLKVVEPRCSKHKPADFDAFATYLPPPAPPPGLRQPARAAALARGDAPRPAPAERRPVQAPDSRGPLAAKVAQSTPPSQRFKGAPSWARVARDPAALKRQRQDTPFYLICAVPDTCGAPVPPTAATITIASCPAGVSLPAECAVYGPFPSHIVERLGAPGVSAPGASCVAQVAPAPLVRNVLAPCPPPPMPTLRGGAEAATDSDDGEDDGGQGVESRDEVSVHRSVSHDAPPAAWWRRPAHQGRASKRTTRPQSTRRQRSDGMAEASVGAPSATRRGTDDSSSDDEAAAGSPGVGDDGGAPVEEEDGEHGDDVDIDTFTSVINGTAQATRAAALVRKLYAVVRISPSVGCAPRYVRCLPAHLHRNSKHMH